MGFLVSFAGNVTYPKAQNLRDVAAALPLESLLIETDSPFLAPQGQRGRRNEPAYVAEVARTLGPVRNLAPAEVAAATAGNFRRFFGLRPMESRSSLLGVRGTGEGHLTADGKRDFRSGSRRPGAAWSRNWRSQTGAASEPVGEMARYLLGGGGKRLRPALLLLSAGYAGYSGPSAIRLGAVGGADPQRDADSRRRDRRRRHAPRPALGQFALGKSSQRAGRRLAVHAVVPDGARRSAISRFWTS